MNGETLFSCRLFFFFLGCKFAFSFFFCWFTCSLACLTFVSSVPPQSVIHEFRVLYSTRILIRKIS